MPSVAATEIDDIPVRDPDAACDGCGRLGTWAWTRVHSLPPELRRYCRRCWPDAYRAFRAEHDRLAADWMAARQAWWEDARVTGEQPAYEIEMPPATTCQWHWSLIAFTLWGDADRAGRHRENRLHHAM